MDYYWLRLQPQDLIYLNNFEFKHLNSAKQSKQIIMQKACLHVDERKKTHLIRLYVLFLKLTMS